MRLNSKTFDLVAAGASSGSKADAWWSGSTSTGGLSSNNCSGWTSSDGGESGEIGDKTVSGSTFFGEEDAACDGVSYSIMGVAY